MPGWSKRQTKRKVKCPAGANVKPKGKLNAPLGLPVDDDKKCKKKLSFDAVALSGGFFYPELRSTIVRMVWLSLSRIKSISQSPNRLPSASFGRSCMLSLMLGAEGLCLHRGCSSYGGCSGQEPPLPTWRSTLATTH